MNYEIEKKFLIAKPDEEFLKKLPGCEFSEIEQIYLKAADGVSERIRMRKYDGSVVYYHTLKKRISDMRRIEEEKTVTADEYNELKKRADKDLSAIYKCRYCIPYDGHILEIDVFPFWKNRAYLEVELSDEEIKERLKEFTPKEHADIKRGFVRNFIDNVTQADEGCDLTYMQYRD